MRYLGHLLVVLYSLCCLHAVAAMNPDQFFEAMRGYWKSESANIVCGDYPRKSNLADITYTVNFGQDGTYFIGIVILSTRKAFVQSGTYSVSIDDSLVDPGGWVYAQVTYKIDERKVIDGSTRHSENVNEKYTQYIAMSDRDTLAGFGHNLFFLTPEHYSSLCEPGQSASMKFRRLPL